MSEQSDRGRGSRFSGGDDMTRDERMVPAPSPISELNERSREIFRLIVDGYVQTGEPIGSRTLSRLLGQHLSPATIRNVMADLEEAGLLYAPHTSAGRLPTEAGLRLFVNGLLEIGNLVKLLTLKPSVRSSIFVSDRASELGSPVTGYSLPSYFPVHSLCVGLPSLPMPSIVTFTSSPAAS